MEGGTELKRLLGLGLADGVYTGIRNPIAGVVELVDAPDSKSGSQVPNNQFFLVI
jgi:hypothetical protein